jgi:hypothetical protein
LHSKSQYTTVKHSQQLLRTHVHVRPIRSRNTHSYRILPTGPLVAIFQHSLPFLVRRLLNTRRDNPSSGYRSTCTPQRHLGVYIINPPFTSPDDQMSSPSTVALRITSNLYSFSDPTQYIRSIPNTTNLVTTEMPVHCCQHNNAACLHCYRPITLRPSSIVA